MVHAFLRCICSDIFKQYCLLLFILSYCVSFVFNTDHPNHEKCWKTNQSSTDVHFAVYLEYIITMLLDIVVLSLFGLFETTSSWKTLWQSANNLNQFSIIALLCVAYQVFSAILLWSNGPYNGFVHILRGIKWILEGISNTVPGLFLHHESFTFHDKSLNGHLLFIIFVGKLASFLLDPGLFRQQFLCRIGAMYNCRDESTDCTVQPAYTINEIILRPFMAMALFDTIIACVSKHTHGSLTILFKIAPCWNCVLLISLAISIVTDICFRHHGSKRILSLVWIIIHLIVIIVIVFKQICMRNPANNAHGSCHEKEDFEALALVTMTVVAWVMLCAEERHDKEYTYSIWRLFVVICTVFTQMIALFEWRQNGVRLADVQWVAMLCICLNLCELSLLYQLSYTFSFAIAHIILWTVWQYIDWYVHDTEAIGRASLLSDREPVRLSRCHIQSEDRSQRIEEQVEFDREDK
eukprot:685864_1